MKYISLTSCINAFQENIKTTSDGFWGILAFLSSIETSSIKVGVSYKFDYSTVSNVLENWFSVSTLIKKSTSSNISYILFSKFWIDELITLLLPKSKEGLLPNIFCVIAWFYQRKEFEYIPTNDELISIFARDLSLSVEELREIFDFSPRTLNFSDEKFTQSEKINALKKRYGHIKSNEQSINMAGQFIVASPKELTRAPFTQTLYSGRNIQKCILITKVPLEEYYFEESSTPLIPMEETVQQIFFGAPGVGKSHYLKSVYKKEDDVTRITFHPETDYSSFVGCYKPQTDDSGEIVYKFQGQAFTEAYVKAWERYVSDSECKDTFLVIEEINRGNCAQIFGDIFQLLDRNELGFSDYSIIPDKDLQSFLSEKFTDIKDELTKINKGVAEGTKMILPPNLHILATMNTSDQSLFPIDSAFKRRWDWVYMPIETKPLDKEGNVIERFIKVNSNTYNWGEFIDKVNRRIFKTTESEDKQLGFWFVKPKSGNTSISAEDFVSKVIFFLWNDIYKDFGDDASSIFNFALDGNPDSKDKQRHSFKDFTPGFMNINESLVDAFIKNLDVKPISKNIPNPSVSPSDETPDEDSN